MRIIQKSDTLGGHIAPKDMKHIQDNKIFTPKQTEWLNETMNEKQDFDICAKHRRVQEFLRKNYNYYCDQESWNINNKALHTSDPLQNI